MLAKHAVETFNAAHGDELAEVRDLSEDQARRHVARRIVERSGGRPDVLLAGPPCQGFSTAGNRLGADPRSTVFWSVFEVAAAVRPRVLVIENVHGILSIAGRSMPRRIAAEMQRLGFTPAMAVLRAEEHGVPQRRTRVFFVGMDQHQWKPPEPVCSRRSPSLLLPGPVTVGEAISDLPPLEPGDELDDVELTRAACSHYQRWARETLATREMLSARATSVLAAQGDAAIAVEAA